MQILTPSVFIFECMMYEMVEGTLGSHKSRREALGPRKDMALSQAGAGAQRSHEILCIAPQFSEPGRGA